MEGQVSTDPYQHLTDDEYLSALNDWMIARLDYVKTDKLKNQNEPANDGSAREVSLSDDEISQLNQRVSDKLSLKPIGSRKRCRLNAQVAPKNISERQHNQFIQDFLTSGRWTHTLTIKFGWFWKSAKSEEVLLSRKTAHTYMNEVTQNLIGRRNIKGQDKDKKPKWVSFAEGDDDGEFLHHHLLVNLPDDFTTEDLKNAVEKTHRKLRKKGFGLTMTPAWVSSISTGRTYPEYCSKHILLNDRSLEYVVTDTDRIPLPEHIR